MVTMTLCRLEDAEFGKDPNKKSIDDTPSVQAMYDVLSAIIAAESGSTTKGAPMALAAVAGAAGRMADKIRRGAIDGVQTSDKADGGTRNRITTEQLVEKKVAQGKSRKEALKEIICVLRDSYHMRRRHVRTIII